eukprot:TRINITY_DN2378_c0_g1_i16.p2 TRINITY_DN2378_c0_g1~~TRINITY_DN2378_c0_g1_i16.p2  ORF type:complete len:191 (+),score=-17.99 TRINITY_DN2378_c0_g1_i16:485-1057(+)
MNSYAEQMQRQNSRNVHQQLQLQNSDKLNQLLIRQISMILQKILSTQQFSLNLRLCIVQKVTSISNKNFKKIVKFVVVLNSKRVNKQALNHCNYEQKLANCKNLAQYSYIKNLLKSRHWNLFLYVIASPLTRLSTHLGSYPRNSWFNYNIIFILKLLKSTNAETYIIENLVLYANNNKNSTPATTDILTK